jgi:glycosyltransferase involved in cell wall biosynthesis
MKISVILPTAREDHSLMGLPNTHLFEPTVRSLKNQTLTDFELIIVDNLFKARANLFADNTFQGEKLSFPVKHIPPKPSPYLERGMWHIANDLNTGYINADGELLFNVGDGAEFIDPTTLQKLWNYHERKCFAHALITYFNKGEPLFYNDVYTRLVAATPKCEGWSYKQVIEFLDQIYKPGEAVRDSRWHIVSEQPNGVYYNAPIASWWYGYATISLEAILKLNGYDELFDGTKGLEDCDFGARLRLLGYNNLVLDSNLSVIEHWHGPVSTRVLYYSGRGWKSNYQILQLNQLRCRSRANAERLPKEDFEFIRQKSVGCDGVTEEDTKNLLFDWWAANQPIFDLKEERSKLCRR